MSSLSKASQGALEALKAIKPFLTLRKHENEIDVERSWRLSRATTLVGSEEGDFYPNGFAKTLRSAASFFYTSDYEDTARTDVDNRSPLQALRRKDSATSLRGLFRRKSLSQCSRLSEDNGLPPPPYHNIMPPRLDVVIPQFSLRERAGGLTSQSGTNLIDPTEFELETSDDEEDVGLDEEKPRTSATVTFDPRIDYVPSTAAERDSSVMASRQNDSSANLSKGRKFPLRNRLSMKRSLDRLHAKINEILTPSSPASEPEQSRPLDNGNVVSPDGSPLVPTMGPREGWQTIRAEREKRYREAMRDAPPTESDDSSDIDLDLQRLCAASCCEENDDDPFSDRFMTSQYQEGPLRFAVEANERNCGSISDKPDGDESGPGLPNAVQESHFGSNTTLLGISSSSSSSSIPKKLKLEALFADTNDKDGSRGRQLDRNSSARRSTPPLTPTRLSPPSGEEMDTIALPRPDRREFSDMSNDTQLTLSSQDTNAWTTTVNSDDRSTADVANSTSDLIRAASIQASGGIERSCSAEFLADYGGHQLDIHDASKQAYIEDCNLNEYEAFERRAWNQTWHWRTEMQKFTLGASDALAGDLQAIQSKFEDARAELKWWFLRRTTGILQTHFEWPSDDDLEREYWCKIAENEAIYGNGWRSGDADREEDGQAEYDHAAYGYDVDAQEDHASDVHNGETELAPEDASHSTLQENPAAGRDENDHDDTDSLNLMSLGLQNSSQWTDKNDDDNDISPLVTNRYVQDIFDFTRLAEQDALAADSSSESSGSLGMEM